jgi:hypothetical protein
MTSSEDHQSKKTTDVLNLRNGHRLMNDNYIDQFGSNRNYTSSGESNSYYVPIVMTILSFTCFLIYLLSALGSRSVIMCVVFFVPIFSIIGLVFSFITRDSRYDHHKIWVAGLIGCALSLFLMVLLFFGTMAALAQD